jgi:hypothetical protein
VWWREDAFQSIMSEYCVIGRNFYTGGRNNTGGLGIFSKLKFSPLPEWATPSICRTRYQITYFCPGQESLLSPVPLEFIPIFLA